MSGVRKRLLKFSVLFFALIFFLFIFFPMTARAEERQILPAEMPPLGEVESMGPNAGPEELGPMAGPETAASGKDEDIPVDAEQNLGELLAELAQQQSLNGYEELIAWLLATPMLDDHDRQTIHQGILEDESRLGGLFETLNALRERVAAETPEAEEEAVGNAAEILAAGREMAEAFPATGEAVMSRRDGKTELNDPLIDWIEQTVTPATDANGEAVFRHYQVRTAFETKPWQPAGEPVDIVLVIDNSRSMQGVLTAVKEAALAFIARPELANSGSRVAVVTFSDAAGTTAGLSDPGDPGLRAAIQGIRTADMSNLQAGILAARQVFGMDDDSVYAPGEGGRRRAVVLLTDGATNYRYTDVWKYSIQFEGQRTVLYAHADPQTGPVPGPGEKRWSWADSLEVLPFMQKIHLDGETLNTQGVNINNTRMAKDIARLEAQRLAGQGLELYGVSYGNAEYLREMCRVMTTQPDFYAPIYSPPYEGAAMSTAPEGTRVFDPADPQLAAQLCEALWGAPPLEAPALRVNDRLEDAFELVEGSFFFTDARGAARPPLGEVTYADGQITWTLPAGLDPGDYALNYTVRVKDDPAEPMRYYPDGAKGQALSREAGIGYESAYHEYGKRTVDVPPLLWAAAPDFPALAGDTVTLTGAIKRGNGNYTYAWRDAQETILDSGTVPLDGIEPASGLGLHIPVPPWDVKAEPGGGVYYLEVTDTWAWNDGQGYSGGRLRLPVRVTAVDASLTIRVVGADGREIPGKFEVTICKTVDDEPAERYHYLGLGEVTYDTATGLTQGEYEIAAYAPYGYRVTAQDKQRVNMAPIASAGGGWAACHETVTIEISPTWPEFFFRWIWGD